MDILKTNLCDIAARVSKGELKAEAVVQAYYNQSQKHNKKINAFITINDKAIEAAREVDKKVARGEKVGRLAGVPIAVKDMLCTKGIRTTAGSKILENFIPPYSATVVEKMLKEDAIVLGKTNQDEFAMGSSNESSHFGNCKNPWDLDYVPGGSSGGSAAAVAARMSPVAIGTDTGGSIRQPANFCGIVGAKPTYGRVSRFGIVAFASSLDQAGPMATTVQDTALVMESISGQDPNDSTCSSRPVPTWTKNLSPNLKGMKIGLPKEYFSDAVSADVRKILDQSIQQVKDAGAQIIEVTLPLTEWGVPIYYLIATCEASSNLARYDGVRFGYRADFSKVPASSIEEFYSRTRGEGFGSEVKRRIMLGTFALSSGYYDAYYKKACQVRRLLRDDFMKAFAKVDVLMSPVTTSPAFKVGERISNPLEMYLNDIFTTSTNLAGIPGMSVPGGKSSSGMPIGVQLTAAHFEEQKMLDVAAAIEQRVQFYNEVPSVIR